MATTGELASVTEHVRAFYRLMGATSSDESLAEQGESTDDIVYLALTRGFRAAQRWLIAEGLSDRWRKRSSAITSWSGTDAADGGRYKVLADGVGAIATDFLRLDGDRTKRSALVEANGDSWGCEIDPDESWREGDYYYLSGDRLWLARTAAPPSTLYLKYFYRLPAITSATTAFDMDVDARWLAVAEAAQYAVNEEWVPSGDNDVFARIDRALQKAKEECRSLARRTRQPRRFTPVQAYGGAW